ncbi:hypothetical protein M9458_014046 [Cirrhinus mrigala]|uniref:Methyltransferase type 11 domain-containing protein n=1 Tax=Cirrhinus mrigala TaxID=683832 RepID=A0ABD0QYM8_CIRMR
MNDSKRELFRNLEKFYPPKGALRILEVGCGSGANFEHYPTGCRITCTDPNPHFQKYLKKTMAKNDHLVYDSFIVASGENLKAVEDNSVDVVVPGYAEGSARSKESSEACKFMTVSA